MPRPKKQMNLYAYEDYRIFLRDYYDNAKAANPRFSYRLLSRRAGFSSPNFLKLVIEGKRNLTLKSLPKVMKAVKLNKDERSFFENLVFFNQNNNPQEKNIYYERMLNSRHYRRSQTLARDQFQYYSQWYYSAIRELVNLKEFKEDPNWIAKALVPKITPTQAERGIELLLGLNLLERDSSGKLRQVDPTISSGDEVRSLALVNFHQQMLERAEDALMHMSSSNRDISCITLGIPEQYLSDLKESIGRFRKQLLNRYGEITEPADTVFQINIQMFPLAKSPKEDDHAETFVDSQSCTADDCPFYSALRRIGSN